MRRYRFAQPARARLLDELMAAGVTPQQVEMDGGPDYTANPGTQCWVTCDPAQYDAVAQVVAAHDAAAIDAAAQRQQQAVKAAWQTLGAAAQANQTLQAVKVLFQYLNSQLS